MKYLIVFTAGVAVGMYPESFIAFCVDLKELGMMAYESLQETQ